MRFNSIARVLSFVLSLFFIPALSAQPAQVLNMFTPQPPPVTQANATYTGQQFTGSQPIFYFVIGCYTSGCTPAFGPIRVTGSPGLGGLNAQRYVTINWAALPNATFYHVLRSASSSFPANPSCADCAVALQTTSTSAVDTGAALQAFPPNGYTLNGASNGNFRIDNVNYNPPQVLLTVDGQTVEISGDVESFYQTVANNGTAVTQRSQLNFVPGTNISFSFADSSNPSRTSVTINAASSAALPSLSGTYASVNGSACGAAETGQMGMLTDVDLVGRCSGSAWEYWYKGFKADLPSVAGTWVNQGSATLTNTTGVAILTMPSASGSNIRGQYFSTPTPPYTVTVGVYVVDGVSSNSHCGLAIRNSGSGAIHTWAARFSTTPTQFPFLENIRWNSATVFGGVNLSVPTAWPAVAAKEAWLRLNDDGVNRNWSYSKDGYQYKLGYTESRTYVITADQWGYYCYTERTADTPIGTFFHVIQN